MFEIGDTYTQTFTLTDATGTNVDATSVVCTVTAPDGSTTTPTLAQPSVGSYVLTYAIALGGMHQISVVWSGTNASSTSDVFYAAGSSPGYIISLADARAGLGLAASNKTNDEDLRMYINAATPIMEDILGSVISRTRVETFDGGSPTVALMYPPVLSVTTVIESAGTSWQKTLTAQNIFTGGSLDSYGYTVDLNSGILTRRAAGVAMPFMPGRRNIQVTYVAGLTLSPNQYEATRRLVRWLVQTEQQNYNPGQNSPDALMLAQTPGGFMVPPIVLTLCGASQRPQGLA